MEDHNSLASFCNAIVNIQRLAGRGVSVEEVRQFEALQLPVADGRLPTGVCGGNHDRKTLSSGFYTGVGELRMAKIRFLVGLLCGTFLLITGVPLVFLLIFIQ